MTPDEVADARHELGLTVSELAEALRLAMPNGRTTVREWENGRREISGPASVAIECMLVLRAFVDMSEDDGLLIAQHLSPRWEQAIERADDLTFAGEVT